MQHIADYVLGWRSILAQKTVLVCFKSDSDDIVGVNFNFVNSEEDNFMTRFRERVSFCTASNDILLILYTFHSHFSKNL